MEAPLRIGPLTLRNRIVRGAAGVALSRGVVNDVMVAYHRARAAGGVALTILGDAGVHPSANGAFELWHDEFVPGHRAMADECHRLGMALFQELSHQGAAAVTASPSWAASAVPDVLSGRVPVAMTQAMIDEIVEAFAAAARRCRTAGLDGVEVHAAHGYLLGQFLSPLTNRRDDAYGGDSEGRSKLLFDVLEATRRAVGDELAVGVRLSVSEHLPEGFEPKDVEALVARLEARGLVDYIDLSTGVLSTFPTIIGAVQEPHGYQLEDVLAVAASCTVPTIVTGRIHTLAEAESILASPGTSMVSIVRATIADPALVVKSLAGRESEVRPCIACNECLRSIQGPLKRVSCAVNPVVGAGDVEELDRVAGRRVLVVGGGPAGLEAARTAALRGHDVVLCEASDHLGGMVAVARLAPHRDDIGQIVEWQGRELERLGVDVRLGTRVTRSMVEELSPDAVVVAVGAAPSLEHGQPAVGLISTPGATPGRVWTTAEAHTAVLPPSGAAVVLDAEGDYAAIGAAERLATEGLDVAFVSHFGSVGARLGGTQQEAPAAQRLAELGVRFIGHSYLTSIGDTSVTVRDRHGAAIHEVDADVVVIGAGRVPETGLATALAAWPGEVIVIGDAVAPRTIGAAIDDGWRAGRAL